MAKPLALVPAYNEIDILSWTVRHLLGQGCDVHVIDNWSTDGSREAALAAGATVERWPKPIIGPMTQAQAALLKVYDIEGLHRRIEEIAAGHPGRWIIFCDADEIRRPPAPDGSVVGNFEKTLAQALAEVEARGFNAISYRAVTFAPVDDLYVGDPERHFRYYVGGGIDTHCSHVKTWLQGVERVDMHSSGGHVAAFSNMRIAPDKFVLKHYPIRTQAQGERKVFRERKPRYLPSNRRKGWHVQYDQMMPGGSFIRKTSDLAGPVGAP